MSPGPSRTSDLATTTAVKIVAQNNAPTKGTVIAGELCIAAESASLCAPRSHRSMASRWNRECIWVTILLQPYHRVLDFLLRLMSLVYPEVRRWTKIQFRVEVRSLRVLSDWPKRSAQDIRQRWDCWVKLSYKREKAVHILNSSMSRKKTESSFSWYSEKGNFW